MEKTQKKRIEYLDLIRVIAIYCVMLVHTYAFSQRPNALEIGSSAWIQTNIWSDIVRWALDLFVMISGAVFLSRDVDVKVLYTKYIKRILAAYILWGICYALIIDRVSDIKSFIKAVALGHSHMWYCPMVIGLYMITPLLRQWVKDLKIAKYFLIISFIACSGIPSLCGLADMFPDTAFCFAAELVSGFFDKMNLQFLLGYVFFYVLGYYMKETVFSKKQIIIMYILGIIGVMIECGGTIIWSIAKGEAVSAFMGNFAFSSVISAIAVFEFAKHHFKTNKFIKTLSDWSFGIYMAHMGIIELLVKYFDITRFRFLPFLYLPLLALLILFLSAAVSGILHYIPFLKKYMV